MVPVFLAALAALAAALVVPGWRDLVLLAGPMALASLWLIWRNQPRRRQPGPKRRHVVVDGSNVLHWRDQVPDIATVRAVVRMLTARGFTPGVMFDANVGYKIGDRYQDDAEIARRLGLPVDQVIVVPKGVVADAYVLKAAKELGAPVVSNDRFRDWSEDHPDLATPGRLIRGGFRDGKPWLEGMV